MVNLWHQFKAFLELKCETSEENRENIQWIFNGRYVFDGDFDKDFKIDKNILKIKNIQLYHTGQYECSGMDITYKLMDITYIAKLRVTTGVTAT